MKLLPALLLLALATPSSATDTVRFAVLGDTPYFAGERHLLPKMLERIGERGHTLAIHVGDFKSGQSPCSDEVFADRKRLFDAAPLAFVYVPGDNDWTDCHRTSNGGYEPRERLARLRALFFAEPKSLGRTPVALERQSAATPEHLRWKLGPVRFVTLNVPGDDNNWGRRTTPSAEYRQRQPKVLAWLRDGFALARREEARVLVIALQANPDFRLFAAGSPVGPFRELLELVRNETRDFPGEVLFVHGDTHHQRIDHPLRDDAGKPLARFTRIETWGSPFMGWTEIEVSSDRAVPLRIEAQGYEAGRSVLP